ncbi:NAD(P)/FAD-dependent oxidoreductase [Flavimaricola marinus]|uniref:Hydrogen cyanide synthase subunit HcnC n=1 Tax=Flavimaricola marinus TaxID=1819565 RepID=A0A238L8T6_9RHOB|nr:FAD-dependent oxidoreductase [Flavimaricola marinus]SMY06002.1 Hydrogen cyanide synthase subunit HcnC precursor [Flavimaricola marinus]
MIDFLVIGGGIAGVSAGARLSHLGKVTLLERESALGYHASGRSAALFEENYGKPSTIALNMASKAYHQTANGGVLSQRGLMLIGTAQTDEAFDTDCAVMKLPEISVAEARGHIPILNDAVTRAALDTEAWDIDTDRLIQNFAAEIRSNGGAVVPKSEVTAIERRPHGWQVRCGEASYEAKTLVNAAGAWVDQIARLAGITPLGVTPLRRSMARIPAPGGHDVARWPMLFGPGEDWYAKPDAGALIVSPAEEDPSEPMDAWADDMVLAEGLARYEAHVTEPVTRLLTSWAGLRTFSPDRQLVLGRSVDDPGFVWSAGQGGYGFQTAPAASQLIAELVAGEQTTLDAEMVARLSPARFRQ